jgi:hypothetical protein
MEKGNVGIAKTKLNVAGMPNIEPNVLHGECNIPPNNH